MADRNNGLTPHETFIHNERTKNVIKKVIIWSSKQYIKSNLIWHKYYMAHRNKSADAQCYTKFSSLHSRQMVNE